MKHSKNDRCRKDLVSHRQAFSPIDFSAIVQADNVERVLTDIDARLRQSQSVLSQAWRAPCLGAPGQLIAGGAGARPDHPISGPCASIVYGGVMSATAEQGPTS
jgi:hypothetical protein